MQQWGPQDNVREIQQNNEDQNKAVALTNGCDMTGLKTITMVDEENKTIHYLRVCTLADDSGLSTLSSAAMDIVCRLSMLPIILFMLSMCHRIPRPRRKKTK